MKITLVSWERGGGKSMRKLFCGIITRITGTVKHNYDYEHSSLLFSEKWGAVGRADA